MENFAAVIRTLLARIRALPPARTLPPRPEPPVMAYSSRGLYRTPQAGWGKDPARETPAARKPGPRATPRPAQASRVREAEAIPAPRGLLST